MLYHKALFLAKPERITFPDFRGAALLALPIGQSWSAAAHSGTFFGPNKSPTAIL
jgi:hypothetical protein